MVWGHQVEVGEEEEAFLVLGCDGLFDVCSDDEVATQLRRKYRGWLRRDGNGHTSARSLPQVRLPSVGNSEQVPFGCSGPPKVFSSDAAGSARRSLMDMTSQESRDTLVKDAADGLAKLAVTKGSMDNITVAVMLL